MVKYPKWWIKKWVTLKSGRRFPVLRDFVYRRLKSLRASPLQFVPATEVRETFLKHGITPTKEFALADLPSEAEIQVVVDTLTKFERLFKDTMFAQPFYGTRLTFFRYAPGSPLGFFHGYYYATHNPTIVRDLTSKALSDLGSVRRHLLEEFLGVDPQVLYRDASLDPWVKKNAEALYLGGHRSYLSIGTCLEEEGISFPLRRIVGHEVGHLVHDTLIVKDLSTLEKFKDVYSSYLRRVADEGYDYYVHGGLFNVSLPEARESLFYSFRSSLYEKKKSNLLTFYSLRGIDEGFCEALGYYITPSDRRKILRKKWPEAVAYFDKLFQTK